ncbi:MAG: pseudouridine synthase [Leptolyngbya sp. IPPAS B-1204]|nr:rRNA pseudouridine synthase [Elainella sp. C42_A2020_010]RNJ69321.1 MAG: rRNA pseudouridine synthase [Leptolyngbya sp. IPPAS B-1204]
MTERLQKILSQWGIASRRQAEQMILDGRVRLNGAVGQLGQKADPQIDSIEVDGKLIQLNARPQTTYLLLHKPAGVVSTCHDPQGRPTVLNLLPAAMRQLGLHPVGRLDAASTGALLLTNDGEVTACLTHPRHSIAKIYRVRVQGHPSEAVLRQWRQGVLLEGRLTRPAEVRVLQTNHQATLLEIRLKEGRNRQIRRVAEQLGFPVMQLHRVAIGTIQLGKLETGQYRALYPDEVAFLQSEVQQAKQQGLSAKEVAKQKEVTKQRVAPM